MESPLEHPYARFIKRVQKPSSYLGGEHGETIKDWSAVDARVCLAFPDLYEIGMSHLGFKILYSILNKHPKILAERAYAPWADMEAELRAENEPLRSLETWHTLRDFDVVGFSLQFELTYTNVLLMLDLGRIPLRAENRGDDDPLVVAGGPTATHAEPLAPFVDCFLIGDGEERTPELVLLWSALKKSGMPRRERLRQLARLEGVYVPSLYDVTRQDDTGFWIVDKPLVPEATLPIRRTFIRDLNRFPFPADGPVAASTTIFDRVSVEIARGCTEGCRFCQAGMIYRPVRERDPEDIIRAITEAVRDGGYDEASLTCLSTADYSAISPLVREVMDKFKDQKVSLSVSSLRAYGLGEELLDEIQTVRATGLTFAPEAGTQRMRDVVNKNVTEEQLMETAERVFSRGWSKMKLYFMIGLPTEEDEDVLGIVQTGARAQQVGKRVQKGNIPRVTVSVSTHVPKPHTPFQWCAMDERETVLRKQKLLREESRKTNTMLKMHDSTGSWIEGILSRGDRSLAQAIEYAYLHGARFDSWEEMLKIDVWEEALRETNTAPHLYLGTIPVTARLPWDHIDVGLEDGFLAREYRKALKNRLSPPCGKAVGAFIHHTNLEDANADTRKLVCYDCGVACDMTQMRNERVDFLVKLGAKKKPEPKVREATPVVRGKERLPTASFDQGSAIRVRLGFKKLGRSAFTSHLDLVKLLPRILRRVGMPLFYTQGFHPKPEMVFAPALSLGISSVAEYADVKIAGELPCSIDELVTRLNATTSDGFYFIGARVLGPNDASITRVIDEAVYAVALPKHALEELQLQDEAALSKRIADQLAKEKLFARRETDGIGRMIDIRPYLIEVNVGDGAEALRSAGILGEFVTLTMRQRITNDGAAKAQEALDAILDSHDVSARIVRAGLLSSRAGTRATPLDLEALRKPRAEPTEFERALAGGL